MKKIINKIINNILLTDLIFIGINILLCILLAIFHLRYRLWLIIFTISTSLLGLLIGAIQKTVKSNKKLLTFIFIIFVMTFILSTHFLSVNNLFKKLSLSPEHVVEIDLKKYVGIVEADEYVNVKYYNYYGPFMGTKKKIEGYFGAGNFDPYTMRTNVPEEYIYYEEEIATKKKTVIKDKNGYITLEYTEEIKRENIDNNDNSNKDNKGSEYNKDNEDNKDNNKDNNKDVNNSNEESEEPEIVYEKTIANSIFRFKVAEYVLGQNRIIVLERSDDNGKNFYYVNKEGIKVSTEPKFKLIDKNQMFISSNGKIDIDSSAGLYVSNDGGKTFDSATFKYKNNIATFFSIESMPYYEDNNLYIKCSVYDIKENGNGYEEKELIFISKDEGLTWTLK